MSFWRVLCIRNALYLAKVLVDLNDAGETIVLRGQVQSEACPHYHYYYYYYYYFYYYYYYYYYY